MNWVITLLALELLWMVWRDLDFRRYREDLSALQKSAEGNIDIWRDNYRGAMNEVYTLREKLAACEVSTGGKDGK